MSVAARGVIRILLLLCGLCVGLAGPATSQEAAMPEVFDRAPVHLDGELLFQVRGSTGLPADERAQRIRERLIEAASDPAFDPATIELREVEYGIELWGSGRFLCTIANADARLEGLDTRLLATVIAERLKRAISDYREARTPEALRRALQVIAVATIAFVAIVGLILLLARASSRLISRQLDRRIAELERRAKRVIRLQQLWKILQAAVQLIFVALGVVALYYYVITVLLALPWTHGFAERLLAIVTRPLVDVAWAILGKVPDLIVLAVIILVTRYVLRVARTFFERVRAGNIKLADFEPAWAGPTERLIRLGIVAFAVIMAYPYIPGSGSDAFKGLSIFAGVILSLGASSLIGNIVAGYSMIYRRAFQVGDRIEIAGILGVVEETRSMATYLRTIKNERVTVPNSVVLSNQVVNYTHLARESGLILHTEITIGYEVPWREVEAMLVEAARRTPHLLEQPAPFVLQKSLGDYAPVYELNAYTHDEKAMAATYSALHANIQDVFAEKGVQIMTPHYVADPEVAKVPPVEAAAARPALSRQTAPAAGPARRGR
jgi:small-conductance mechanosensitive channel